MFFINLSKLYESWDLILFTYQLFDYKTLLIQDGPFLNYPAVLIMKFPGTRTNICFKFSHIIYVPFLQYTYPHTLETLYKDLSPPP